MALLYESETYQIIGLAQEVHRELGPGFLEAVHHDALALEFSRAGIPFEREFQIPIFYKGVRLEKRCAADFYCFGKIIVEIKAVKELTDAFFAQVMNYLKATRARLGLLMNFGEQSLRVKRIIN